MTTRGGWPQGKPFDESRRDTLLGGGPDFPGSQGGREMGKFRPSQTPLLDQVAVVNDDGSIIGHAQLPNMEMMIVLLTAIKIGIEMLVVQATDADADDLDLMELANTDLEEKAISLLPA